MTVDLARHLGEVQGKLDALIRKVDENRSGNDEIHDRLNTVEHQNERLLEQNRALSQRIGETEEFVAEYQKIKQIGRGYILGAAMAGTGFGVWLSDGLMQVLKALKGG
ncbi:aminoacyltransferase [Martelella lutilitoris]|uniref:Aminoacyltransferase n=1 Tax=Martelella lutilitoris TaxID=2583532 RepID=A0A5C4JNL2_9HYPH|nr:aminoacyltransferase [Martelella lutilitoris]TNB46791.1 aminoacyltransferase [Martelella lutilitoris]